MIKFEEGVLTVVSANPIQMLMDGYPLEQYVAASMAFYIEMHKSLLRSIFALLSPVFGFEWYLSAIESYFEHLLDVFGF